jgi:TIR domain
MSGWTRKGWPTARFAPGVRKAIEDADAFVLVISPDSARSRYCVVEVEHAAQLGKRIVPILLRSVGDEPLPAHIRERNKIPGNHRDAVARVLRALETDLEQVRAHTRWTARAVQWQQADRDRSLLPRGSELAAGEAWLAACGPGADPAPTTLQREVLLAARRASSGHQRRLLIGSAGALAVSLALLVLALIARRLSLVATRESTQLGFGRPRPCSEAPHSDQAIDRGHQGIALPALHATHTRQMIANEPWRRHLRRRRDSHTACSCTRATWRLS